jgi:hypothetical protein
MREKLEYWIGITEHTCDSERPIGSCLKCDLDEMLVEIQKDLLSRVDFYKKLATIAFLDEAQAADDPPKDKWDSEHDERLILRRTTSDN